MDPRVPRPERQARAHASGGMSGRPGHPQPGRQSRGTSGTPKNARRSPNIHRTRQSNDSCDPKPLIPHRTHRGPRHRSHDPPGQPPPYAVRSKAQTPSEGNPPQGIPETPTHRTPNEGPSPSVGIGRPARQVVSHRRSGVRCGSGGSKGGRSHPRQNAMFNVASAGSPPEAVDIELAERRGMGRALGNDVKELRLVTRPCGPAARSRRGGARTSSSVVRRGVRNRARTSPARRAARRVNPLSCRTARTR